MNRIERRFQELKKRGEPAFVAFVTAGDPTLARTLELVGALDAAGVDVLELGIPYSDPIADGVVNQEAAQRALRHNVCLRDVLAMVREARARSQMPIVLFTYYNPVLAYGTRALARDAAEAGVDGILCVDLPPEEADEYRADFGAAGLSTIFLIAPTSTEERIALIAKSSTGFIYYVSRTGVTGERTSLEQSVRGMVERIRGHSDLPVAVGFGVSSPAQAAELGGFADGVVVGSAIVRLIGQLGDNPEMPGKVGAYVQSLVAATKGQTLKATSK